MTRNSVLLDRLTESVMETVLEQIPKVLDSPDCYETRAELMLAADTTHNDMIGQGGDFARHELSHALTEL